MHRQPYRARLVHDGALDVLADPPRGVGGKPEAAFRVEFLERVDEAQIALFHQIEQRHAAVQVVLGDVHDQAQIALDHDLPRLEVAQPHPARQRELLFRREQRIGADLVQIELGGIAEEFRLGRLDRLDRRFRRIDVADGRFVLDGLDGFGILWQRQV